MCFSEKQMSWNIQILTGRAETALQQNNSENWNEMRTFPPIFKCLLPFTKMALTPPVDTSTKKSPSFEKPEGAEEQKKENIWEKNNKSEQEQYTVFGGRVFRDGSWIIQGGEVFRNQNWILSLKSKTQIWIMLGYYMSGYYIVLA